jgi:hypothetical protein
VTTYPDVQLPPGAFKTYSLRRPPGRAFWRKATCEEFGCSAWRNGWVTRVPAGSPQAAYITGRACGRRYFETTGLDQTIREFMFEPGQMCFGAAGHRIAVEREPLYIVRNGDHRQQLPGGRQHVRGEDWRDDMAEHLDGIRPEIEG